MEFVKSLAKPALKTTMVSLVCAAFVGGAVASPSAGTATGAGTTTKKRALLRGETTASYFWDDGSGRNGDTGMPAGGKPMQKGLFSSPSWPLGTEGYVIYKGKKARFFIGDRGPGEPSSRGIMLDMDAKTFADLTGGTFNPGTLGIDGNGGQGHIDVKYTVTKWGSGPGKKNKPVPFSTGAYNVMDDNPAKPPEPPKPKKPKKPERPEKKKSEPADESTKEETRPATSSTTNPSGRPYTNTAAREQITAADGQGWAVALPLAAGLACALALFKLRPRRRAAAPGRHRSS